MQADTLSSPIVLMTDSRRDVPKSRQDFLNRRPTQRPIQLPKKEIAKAINPATLTLYNRQFHSTDLSSFPRYAAFPLYLAVLFLYHLLPINTFSLVPVLPDAQPLCFLIESNAPSQWIFATVITAASLSLLSFGPFPYLLSPLVFLLDLFLAQPLLNSASFSIQVFFAIIGLKLTFRALPLISNLRFGFACLILGFAAVQRLEFLSVWASIVFFYAVSSHSISGFFSLFLGLISAIGLLVLVDHTINLPELASDPTFWTILKAVRQSDSNYVIVTGVGLTILLCVFTPKHWAEIAAAFVGAATCFWWPWVSMADGQKSPAAVVHVLVLVALTTAVNSQRRLSIGLGALFCIGVVFGVAALLGRAGK
jgi:hypothetical protein